VSGDSRFSKLGTDKKFLSVSKKQKKVKIDKRFQSLFTSEKFASKCSVDKRGRPKSLSAKENFEKFYDLEDSESSDDSDEEELKDDTLSNDDDESSILKPDVEDKNIVVESDIKTKLLSSGVDYARGEADLYSDSSSEEDTESEEEKEEEEEEHEFFDKWGEMDREAERTEDATDRLAVVNMDWDRVGADDIFLVLSSFCGVGGSVTSVEVFLSDLGRERVEEEKTLGPRELRQIKGGEEDDGLMVDKKKAIKEAAAAMDRVRQYQVARLKYYYAVAQFDSVDTAERVYTECDGMEYELSATRLDLRYIPADMTFSTISPTSSCLHPPHPDKYQPKTFFTTALQKGKVELTWDEEDQGRAKAMKEAYSKMEETGEEPDHMGDLIASASEDEEESGDEQGSDEEGNNEKDTINKYRALLAGIGGKDEKAVEGDMEVTWNDEDVTEDAQEEMTPWEKYLQKKKDKKNRKPKTLDDDDVPEGVDMSDPFFADELDDKEMSKKKDKKKKKKDVEENLDAEEDNKLALMVMDSDDEKEHFNFKDIVESETKTGKKRKWKKKKKEVEIPAEDSFQVDVADDRFSALFSRPEYNIDPTEPNFKKTKNMEKIIDEKQKRIGETIKTEVSKEEKKQKLEPEVSSTLKSVKNKWKKNAKKIKK